MKKLTILAVLLFAVIGSVFAQKGGEVKMDPKVKAEKMSQKLKADLDLNEEQYNQLLALNLENTETREAHRAEMKAEMEAKRAAMKAEREAYAANLKSILTDEQYIKYLKARGERMNEHGEARRVRSPRKRMH
jgi:protein CpxP